jgi:hypothetical protein
MIPRYEHGLSHIQQLEPNKSDFPQLIVLPDGFSMSSSRTADGILLFSLHALLNDVLVWSKLA